MTGVRATGMDTGSRPESMHVCAGVRVCVCVDEEKQVLYTCAVMRRRRRWRAFQSFKRVICTDAPEAANVYITYLLCLHRIYFIKIDAVACRCTCLTEGMFGALDRGIASTSGFRMGHAAVGRCRGVAERSK